MYISIVITSIYHDSKSAGPRKQQNNKVLAQLWCQAI